MGSCLGPSSISKKFLKRSQVRIEMWFELMLLLAVECPAPTPPASTQQKLVSKAVGDPGGPNCRLLNNTVINMSTPSSRSILLGEQNSGSANCMSEKCFHLASNSIDFRGRL